MKLNIDIEIDDEEIKEAISAYAKTIVKNRVLDRVNIYGAEDYVKRRVSALYNEHIDTMITEELQNSSKIREQILDKITNKLKNQITAAMKNGDV